MLKSKAHRTAVFFAAVFACISAHAKTLTVANTSDDGAGSLRATLERAASGDVIEFAANVTGTIVLNGDLELHKELTIKGPGADKLTISGDEKDTIFNLQEGSLTISGLSMVKAQANGAIFAPVPVTVSDCRFSDNQSFTNGAAINSLKSAKINNCTFSHNESTSQAGAVYNLKRMTIINCTFDNNKARSDGGALLNFGVLTLDHCVFTGNRGFNGGALANKLGEATLKNCRFSGNAAFGDPDQDGGTGGAIYCGLGSVDLEKCALSRNQSLGSGGAVFNNASMTINQSTLSDNTSNISGGAVLNSFGVVLLVNSTLSGNSAAINGGAIRNFDTVILYSCTVTGNNAVTGAGGGLSNRANDETAEVITADSIIAGNEGAEIPDVSGAFVTNDYNLIGIGDGSTGFMDGENGDQVGSESAPLDAKLGPLGDNGGTTQTHALLPGSPALDQGQSYYLRTDQRGFRRSIDNPAIANATDGDGSDIGAYEEDATQSSTTLTVTTTDDNDDGACTLQHCSLREAMKAANKHVGADVIRFNIPKTDAGFEDGVFTIQPKSALPILRDEDTTISGNSQAGFIAAPIIVLNGQKAGNVASGLEITAARCVIRSLVVNDFAVSGILLRGKDAANNRVEGCYIGTDASGYNFAPNGRRGLKLPGGEVISDGVDIVEGANHNFIGGSNKGNLLSGGNINGVGVFIVGSGSDSNVVQSNYIGTTISGALDQGNYRGVEIGSGASNNLIGGAGAGQGNLISGNFLSGVLIRDEGTNGNRVQGNAIGTDVSGTQALGNAIQASFITNDDEGGVTIVQGAQNNLVGGSAAGTGNIISGNGEHGIVIDGTGTSGNLVQGNFIGPDFTGKTGIGNGLAGFGGFDGWAGVSISGGAQNNTIGGASSAKRNVISGNSDGGVYISGTGSSHNVVQGNYIGTDDSGTNAVPNSGVAVFLTFQAHENLIGGTTAGAGNLISGNTLGIELDTDRNTVQGNYIGTDASGKKGLANTPEGIGNALDGIYIGAGQHNLIGGPKSGARNVICNNGEYGIAIVNDFNTVQGNFIGVNAGGRKALGNGYSGIHISGSEDSNDTFIGAQGNLIGGLEPGTRNVISGNSTGISIRSDFEPHASSIQPHNNTVQGNFIGTDASGKTAVPNRFSGIFIKTAQDNTIGGTQSGARNVISGNGVIGLDITESKNIRVQSNFIGVDSTDTVALPNELGGVLVVLGKGNLIGGTSVAARNIISGNGQDGILLTNAGTTGNRVQGNFIGLDKTGAALPNGRHGIFISDNAHDNLIGGTAAGEGNRIGFNGSAGVIVAPIALSNINISTGNAIRGNSIFANSLLGIDLSADSNGDGITPNDARDTDTGPNNLQNYPILSRAATSSKSGGVRGSLNSRPNISFAVDFYANNQANSNQIYLGQTTITTNAKGDADFIFSSTQSLTNRSITATATNLATGDTSEFSRAITSQPQSDVTAPTVSFNRSGATNQSLSGTAFDAGSGIARVVVLLTPISDKPSTTLTRQAQVTSGKSGSATFTVDLRGLPSGSYTAQAQAFDLVDNSSFSETTKYQSGAASR